MIEEHRFCTLLQSDRKRGFIKNTFTVPPVGHFFCLEKVLLTLNHIVKTELTENCDIWKKESIKDFDCGN